MADNKNKNDNEASESVEIPGNSLIPVRGKYGVIECDYAYFQTFLDDPDVSEEEAKTFIDDMWGTICQFVRLGYAVHPVQQARDAIGEGRDSCGQVEKTLPESPVKIQDVIPSKGSKITRQFDENAAPKMDAAEEGFTA
jgi:hypothetical protein